MARAHILVARAIFPEVLQSLQAVFEVDANQDDQPLTPEQLRQRLKGKVAALTTGSERIDNTLLAACPDLRIVANMAVGFNNFDIPAMTRARVLATNTPDVLNETTADFGFALLMATARRITESEHFLRAGQWQQWRYDLFAGAEVHGSTLGIIGMGRIGQAIAKRAALGFGMRILYHNRSRLSTDLEQACRAAFVDKARLLSESDHVMLVLPYTLENHHTIAAPELALMKPSATLINIARGGIVDDAALAAALANKRIAAAGLDVFEGEPRVHPDLLALSNVVLTPHIASATLRTRRAMAQLAADNLLSFLQAGRALTPINPEVLA
jgi:glyoxylate/hydroxypyruvate/2-ketogluconate reductase